MQVVKTITADEMVATFLKAEIDSSRFKELILSILQKDNQAPDIITNPNIQDKEENEYRKRVLGEYRGFGRDTLTFGGFPEDVTWKRVKINKSELRNIKYIFGVYWDELSNNTRSAVEGARRVKQSFTVKGLDNKIFWEIVTAIKKGVFIPEMILVSKNLHDDPILLEGHARLTAFMMAEHHIPEEMEAIVGFSKNIHKWKGY